MRYRFFITVLVLSTMALLAGCGKGGTAPSPTVEATSPSSVTQASPTPEPEITETPETQATEMPEYRWSQLLGRDDIRPIYDPEFVPAEEAGYADDELVMGVAIAGEAKAYPIGLLNYREMVNDELAGIPILVTW